MSGIAERYGASVAEIAQVNQIANPSLIAVGQALTIPGMLCPQPLVLIPMPTSATGGVGQAATVMSKVSSRVFTYEASGEIEYP